jgi:conjugal transfer ATP-binding protein TraC
MKIKEHIMLEGIKDLVTNSISKVATFLGEGHELEGDCRARKKVEEALVFNKQELKTVLPYQYEEGRLFENTQSHGFGFELAPSSGADLSLMQALAEMLKTKLPENVVAQFMLFKHSYVGHQLDAGLEPFFQKDGIYKALAEKSLRYHAKASKKGYPNQANIPANLCDYKAYVFFSLKKGGQAQSLMRSLYRSIESEFKVIGIASRPIDKQDLATFINAIVTPDDGFYWPKASDALLDTKERINQHCLKENSSLTIVDTFIDVDFIDDAGKEHQSTVVNCYINKYPDSFSLWQTSDLFSNIYKVQKNISCPFLISFSIMGKNFDKMATLAKTKAYNLAKSDNAIQNFINPYHQDELSDWTHASEGLSKDEICLFDTCYNLILFTAPKDKERHIAQAISNYRDLGFELKPSKCTQWLRFLSALPFMPSEGLWKGLEVLGETRKLSNVNVSSLLPIVADFKGSAQGVLLPTYRNQISFLDTFDDKSFPISNYNYTTCGTTGSGKSHFEQYRIVSALAKGEQVFIIDIGDSYKHLCHALGGVYVDATNITLNPFTLFDFEGKTEIDGQEVDNYIQIRDLIAIMASPNQPLEAIQLEYLLEAVLSAWKKNQNLATIGDVVSALVNMQKQYQGDRRLSDLVTHLNKYTKSGLYGHIFNGQTPSFRDANLVVFELGGLESNEELLKIVMFVMIVVIQGQFYQTSRTRYKRCVIDEAWRYLTDGDSSVATRFIVQGFRTARKHNGGFGVITQTLNDLVSSAQGRAIKACASINHVLLQGDLSNYVTQYPDEFNEQQIQLINSFGKASTQGFASMMISYGGAYTFHRYFADPFSRILFSTKGQEYEAIEDYIKQGLTIEQAVDKVVIDLGVE